VNITSFSYVLLRQPAGPRPRRVDGDLATPIRSKEKLLDPACVKVVFDDRGRAFVFQPQPNTPMLARGRTVLAGRHPSGHFHQHIGLYAYRRDFLFAARRPSRSDAEKL
jgi:3-deoxy-manno-octulosonate cytidylyltransferase (CMP-KDO synthetase)